MTNERVPGTLLWQCGRGHLWHAVESMPCAACANEREVERLTNELTETRRARIGDLEIIGREMCRAEKAEADVERHVKAFEGFMLECAKCYGTAHLSSEDVLGIILRYSQIIWHRTVMLNDLQATALALVAKEASPSAPSGLELKWAAASEFIRDIIDACALPQPEPYGYVNLPELALQVIGRIEEAKVQPAPSGWQQRIAAMSPWSDASHWYLCHFCGAEKTWDDVRQVFVEQPHEADCLWQNAKDALPPAPEGSPAKPEADASPAQDPIAAAVNAQLDPLKDQLIAAGHKLAKDELRCSECGAYYPTHKRRNCQGAHIVQGSPR